MVLCDFFEKFRYLCKQWQHSSTHRRPANGRQTSEALERRNLLAGNVLAVVSSKSLFLSGDASGNSVELAASNGNLVVRGLEGTTVNGQSEFLVRGGSTEVGRHLFAYMNGGNDTLVISPGVSLRKDSYVFMGEGDDLFAMSGSRASRGLYVDLGNGNDSIHLEASSVGRDATFVGALGNKTFFAGNSALGNHLTMVFPVGQDAVVFEDTTIDDDAYIYTGLGNDDVVFRATSFNETLTLDTSLGDDLVQVDPVSSFRETSVALLGGGDDDLLTNGDNSFGGPLVVVGMGGNDSVQLSNTTSVGGGRYVVDVDNSTLDSTTAAARLNSATGALARITQVQERVTSLIGSRLLTLEVSANTISESSETHLIATVARPAGQLGDLVVTLISSDTSELTVPATVTIPGGQQSATFNITAVDDSVVDGTQTVTITASSSGFTSSTQSISVTDDDVEQTPELSLSIIPTTFSEGDGDGAGFGTVTRSGATDEDLVVVLSSSDVASATVPASVTIPAGQTSADFDINIIDDNVADGAVTVTITATASGLTTDTVQITVSDDESSTNLFLQITPDEIAENAGSNAATGEITRTGGIDGDLVVNVTSSNPSLITVPASVTIVAGEDTATFPISVIDNSTFDSQSRPVTISLSSGNLTSTSSVITVTENDQPALQLTPQDSSLDEVGANRTLTMTVTRPTDLSDGDLVVTLFGSDSSELTVPSSVTILDGNESATFTVTTVADDTVDGDQDISVIATASGFISADTAVTVRDSDVAAITVVLDQNTISEGAGSSAVTGTVTRNTDLTSELVVTLSSSLPDTVSPPTSVTIPAGEATASFEIDLVDDIIVNGTRIATITPSAPGHASNAASLNVTDNEVGELLFSFDVGSVSEAVGSNVAVGTITRPDSATASDLVVSLTSSDADALTVPASVTILAGNTSATFNATAVNDVFSEDAQTITVTANANGFNPIEAQVVVADDDGLATLSMAIVPASINDNAGANAAIGTVSRNTRAIGDLTVIVTSSHPNSLIVPTTVTIPNGQSSATFDVGAFEALDVSADLIVTVDAVATDFVAASTTVTVLDTSLPALTLEFDSVSISETGASSTTATVSRPSNFTSGDLVVSLTNSDPSNVTAPEVVTIPDGQTSTTFTLNAVADDVADGTQVVTITATATGLRSASETIAVLDVDGPPALSLTIAPTEIAEDAGNEASFGTVSRNTPTNDELVVQLVVDADEQLVLPTTVTIPTGQSLVTFAIDVLNNSLLDGDREVTLTASAAGLSETSKTISIRDDELPDLTFSLNNSTLSESSGTETATISRPNVGTLDELVVTLSSSNTNKLVVPTTVTIPVGQTSAEFDITTVDNDFADANAIVTISALATGFRLGTAEITLNDNDGPASLNLTLTVPFLNESAGPASAVATLSRNTDRSNDLIVSITSSADGRLSFPSSVIIPAGQSEVTFDVGTLDNNEFSGSQQVSLLATADGLLSGGFTISLHDDDLPPLTLSLDAESVSESAGSTALTAIVSRPSNGPLNEVVIALTSNNTNKLTVPESVTLAADETFASFLVATIDNSIADGDFTVSISASASGFVTGSDVVEVTDKDGPAAISLTLDPTTVSENAGANAVLATVTRNTPTTDELVVSLASSSTRVSTPATVTIPAGESSATFNVGTVDDVFANGDINVTLTASASGHAANSKFLDVSDDDGPAALSLTLSTDTVEEAGTQIVATLRRNTETAEPLTVTIESNNASALSIPQTVVIAAGEAEATFNITAVDNTAVDGGRAVLLTVSADALVSGTKLLVVADNDFGLSFSLPDSEVVTVNDTTITKSESLTVSGLTAPLATVEIDTDGDGFDDGTAIATDDGSFSINVPLAHTASNLGLNAVQLRSTTAKNAVGVTQSFDVHLAIGTVVQFDSSVGTFAVELLDADAPNTTANFTNYFARYTDSIIHRSVAGFIIQGGGFTIDAFDEISPVTTDAPVLNEFNSNNSNIRGTLSMALPGVTGGADLGTSQWFINVADNSGLDAASHTVFGRVIGDGMEIVDRINNLETENLSAQTEQPALNEQPIRTALDFETISGSVSLIAGSDLVTGAGTSFTSELAESFGSIAGSTIRIDGEEYTVDSILSDTVLILNRNATADATNVEAERYAAPSSASYVVFSSIDEILNV